MVEIEDLMISDTSDAWKRELQDLLSNETAPAGGGLGARLHRLLQLFFHLIPDPAASPSHQEYVEKIFELLNKATWLDRIDLDDGVGDLPLVKRLLRNIPAHLKHIRITHGDENDEETFDFGIEERELTINKGKLWKYFEAVSRTSDIANEPLCLYLVDFQPVYRLVMLLLPFCSSLRSLSVTQFTHGRNNAPDSSMLVVLYTLLPQMKSLETFESHGFKLETELLNRIPPDHLLYLTIGDFDGNMQRSHLPDYLPPDLKSLSLTMMNTSEVLRVIREVPSLDVLEPVNLNVEGPGALIRIAEAVEQHPSITAFLPLRLDVDDEDEHSAIVAPMFRILHHTWKNQMILSYGPNWVETIPRSELPFLLAQAHRHLTHSIIFPRDPETFRFGPSAVFRLLRAVPHLLSSPRAETD